MAGSPPMQVSDFGIGVLQNWFDSKCLLIVSVGNHRLPALLIC